MTGCLNTTSNTNSSQVFKHYFNIAYITAELVIAAVSIVGNFLICLAVQQNEVLQTVTNYFLVSLAVADFFVGALAIPCAILTDLGLPHHNLYICILVLSVVIMFTHTSVFGLLAVAVERYVAILLPLHYQQIMRPRNAKVIILLTWAFAFLTGSIPLMGWHKNPPQSNDHCFFLCVIDLHYLVYFNFFTCTLVPLVAMFVIYAHIFMTVRRQIRRRPAVHPSTTVQAGRAAVLRHEVRKATSLFLLLFLFTLCWMPMHVVNCFLLMCPGCHVPKPIRFMAILLSHANSAFNPLLYAYRMKAYRQSVKAMVLCSKTAPTEPRTGSGDVGIGKRTGT